MKREGRPRRVQFRMSETSFEHMTELAAQRELTISKFMRGCVQAEIAEYLDKLEVHLDERVID